MHMRHDMHRTMVTTEKTDEINIFLS